MNIDRFDSGFPETASGRQFATKPQHLDDFIAGPICSKWMDQAACESLAAVRVGHALWQEAGFIKDRFFRDGLSQSQPIRVHRNLRMRRDLSRSTVSRGLKALAKLGLISVVNKGPGRHPTVVIRNISILKDLDDSPPF
jgi:hypothetical protein